MRIPFGLPTAAALLVGPGLSPGFPGPPGVLLAAAALLLVVAFRIRRAAVPCALAAAGLIGVIRSPESSAPVTVPHVATLALELTAWTPHRDGTRFEARLLAVDGIPTGHPVPRVRGRAPDPWPDRPAAARLHVRGRVDPNRGGTVPGAWEGGTLAGWVRVERSAAPVWAPGEMPRWIRLRMDLVERLRHRIPGFAGRLAEAMLLGRGDALLPAEIDVFRRTGVGHLVAVSGLHVGLVALLVQWGLAGLPARRRAALTVIAVWGYAGLAGGAPSAVRAAGGITGAMLGAAVARPRPGYLIVATIPAWILWADPATAASVGFRLSWGAVTGILLAQSLWPTGRFARTFSAAAVSLGAQWGTLPVSVAAFGNLAPVALLPNLVVVPMAALFLPAVGVATVLGPWDPGAAHAATLVARVMGAAVVVADRVLPTWTGLPAPPVWLGPVFLCLPWCWLSLPAPWRARRAATPVAGTVAVLLVAAIPLGTDPEHPPWAAFLDVGQGDAAVVRLTDGSVWVIDVGDDRGGDAARRAVLPFLRRHRIRHVDGLILSHRHRDHVGGLAAFLGTFPDTRIYDAAVGESRGTPAWTDSVIARSGATPPCLVAAGDTIHAGPGGTWTVWHPPRGDPLRRPAHGLNNASLVVLLEDGSTRILFTGDAEREAEAEILQRTVARIDVLKVGHHGSRTSSSAPWLDALAPDRAVVSCGVGNRFGHPHEPTLTALESRGIRVLRTDRDGTVIVRWGATGTLFRRTPPHVSNVLPPIHGPRLVGAGTG